MYVEFVVGVAGLAVGMAGLVIALVALGRTMPQLNVEVRADNLVTVAHKGPYSLAVVEAYALYWHSGEPERLPLGRDLTTEEAKDIATVSARLHGTTENPWCKGRVLSPHVEYLVESSGSGRDVVLTYRVEGRLGWLSKSSWMVNPPRR